MAWTEPRTWADGEVPTATQFNEQFRDNQNELALHAHGGGSGSGTARLGPMEAATLRAGFSPIPTNSTHIIVYDASGTLTYSNSASAVRAVADATHEHTGSWVGGTAWQDNVRTTANPLVNFRNTDGTVNASLTTASEEIGNRAGTGVSFPFTTATLFVGGNGSRAVSVQGWAVFVGQTTATKTIAGQMVYSFNGTGTTVIGARQTSYAGAAATANQHWLFNARMLNVASGTYRFWIEARSTIQSSSNAPIPVLAHVYAQEFEIR